MKITNDDFQFMRVTITAKYDYMKNNHYTDFMVYLKQGHSEKRIAWDLCYSAGLSGFICDTLYKYLNDTHIDTALLTIVREIKKHDTITFTK